MVKRKRTQSTHFMNKSKKSHKSIEKRNKIIMGVFISVIMIGSILGIFVSQDSNNVGIPYINEKGETYNFQPGQNFYTLELEDSILNFYYHPLDLQRYKNYTEKINQVLMTGQTVIIFDPEDKNAVFIDLARFEITNQLAMDGKGVYGAKTENSTSYQGMPILTCDNATISLPLIYFKNGNKSKITYENNCLIMEGNQYDFLQYKDLIVYTSYKIMP